MLDKPAIIVYLFKLHLKLQTHVTLHVYFYFNIRFYSLKYNGYVLFFRSFFEGIDLVDGHLMGPSELVYGNSCVIDITHSYGLFETSNRLD